jgi:DNA-binding MarR family transcriptional regulator
VASETGWLTPDEQATWRAFLLASQLLDEALDRQLQREAGMPHAYYAILVTLSEAPGRRLRMRQLAAVLRYSQSRMTHAVRSLEGNGWVRRERYPDDRRGQLAVLTDEGRRVLERAAPGHVAEARRRVFDRLSEQQVSELRRICETLLVGLDVAASPSPPP